MTRKEQEITELYLETIQEVSKNKENWLSFLKSASYNYKYRFDEQILIYAQKPEATAVAETTVWNKKLKRWINKGSKGIALMTEKNGELGLRFVFDVSDTNSNMYGRKFKLWTAEEKYHNDIIEALENKFGEMESRENLPYAIMSTVFNHIAENMQDYLEQLKPVVANSRLEGVSDKELEDTFLSLLMYSTVALTFSRCGIRVEDYINIAELEKITDFNTFETMTILGTATRDFSKEVLLEISETVINVQKQEKNQNYTFDKNKQQVYDKIINNLKGSVENEYNLQRERELSNSRGSSTTEQNEQNRIGQISQNEIEVPKREQDRNVRDTSNEQQVERTFSRDRADSKEQNTRDSGTNEKTRENNRGIESTKSNGMGGSNEQYSSDSRTNSNKGTNTSLEKQPTEKGADNASFFDDLKIIDILKNAPNVIKNREEIDNFINDFDSNINQLEENKNIEYFKNILGNAYTEFYFNDERLGYVASENGLTIWRGDYLHRTEETFIEWEKVIENFILEYDSRISNREIKTTQPNYNKEEYIFRVGDSIYIGLEEFKIADINNDEYLIYNVQFPLLQERININDKLQKIAENPLNDYLKERNPEEYKNPEENSFNNWLDTFIDEKGILLDDTFELEKNGTLHIFEIGNIVENIKATSSEEQAEIKDMLVKIDFYNGDVIDYFKHLAQALIYNEQEQEIEQTEEQNVEQEENIANDEVARTIANKNRNVNIEYFDLHPEIPTEERNNFAIKDDLLGVGTPKEKFRNNVEAIKVLKLCEEQNRYATPEEQQILSKYVGWGGLKSAFEKDNNSWSEEYNELKNILTDEEYEKAKASSLTAYYTPPLVIRNIYKALENMGLKQANILEPSCRNR